MNENLRQLVEISAIDKQIDEYNPQIQKINAKLFAKKDEIDKLDKQIDDFEDAIVKITNLISDTNRQIAEHNERIKKITSRSASLKKEKEISAVQSEEILTKEQLESLNEDIMRNETLIATKQSDLKTLKEQKQNLQTQLKEIQKEVELSLKEIENNKADLYKAKDEILTNINQKVLSFYEKIRKWAKNTAVVPMRKQACYGCFMHINDKVFASVLRSDEITTCPHCGRILYSELPVNDVSEALAKKPAKKTTAKKSTSKTTTKKASTKAKVEK